MVRRASIRRRKRLIKQLVKAEIRHKGHGAVNLMVRRASIRRRKRLIKKLVKAEIRHKGHGAVNLSGKHASNKDHLYRFYCKHCITFGWALLRFPPVQGGAVYLVGLKGPVTELTCNAAKSAQVIAELRRSK